MKIAKKAEIFNKVAIGLPKRNAFDLSHERIFSCDMGELVPCMVEEVNPNESWFIGGKTLVRTAPLARPMMSTVTIKKQHYFIRNQILWANWNLFMTGGDKFNPEAAVPVPPYVNIPSGGFPVGSIADYLGFPTGATAEGLKVSALPFAAYLRTYQEYFCDENLQDTDLIMLTDGDNTSVLNSVPWNGGTIDLLTAKPLYVNWERDYYTACLPEPQKGPDVTIPLGTTAPIDFTNTQSQPWVAAGTGSPGTQAPPGGVDLVNIGDQSFAQSNGAGVANVDISGTHVVDLSSALSATINDLRLSFSVQRLYERLARGGTRPSEFLRTVWGANPRNLELDRPDYFGGTREFLSVSEVLQQSQTTEGEDGSPQGNMSGHGVALVSGGQKSYHTNDYGIILSLFWVKPKTLYFQGIRKSWLRLENRFDYFFPDLAHIGEQPVLNAEVYASASANPFGTFGYMPYGTDLRYIPDTVHGEFRSTQKDWTMVREFDNAPQLNSEFISTEGMTRRVFADTSDNTDTLYVQHYNGVVAKRCIPRFGSPV